MRWQVVVWILTVVAVLSLAPSAGAAAAAVEVDAALPLRAAGPAEAASVEQPTLLAQGGRGTLDLGLHADRLRLVEVEYWETVHEGPTPRATPESGVRTKDHRLSDVRLDLEQRLEGFTVLAWADGPAAVASSVHRGAGVTLPVADDPSWMTSPDLRVFRLGAPLTVSAPMDQDVSIAERVLGREVPFSYSVPKGHFHLQAADASHGLSGILSGYVSGAALSVRHDGGLLRLQATSTEEVRDGSVWVPGEGWTGPGTHRERLVRYLQFEAAQVSLQVTTQGTEAAVLAAGLAIDVTGHVAVPSAAGSITLADGPERVFEGRSLVLSGDVAAAVAPSEDPQRAALSGSGDVTYVRVGSDAAELPLSAVATAAGAALLIGVAVAAWKAFGGIGGLALFSRVDKEDALEHETRSELYDVVKARPGITPNELVEASGVGWSTVVYHLTVLERNELVIAMKDGRYRRYFDRASGRFANGRKNVVAALRNETSAAIARHIRAHPGAVQRRLAETFGLAASSVHWHIKRLVDAGLVSKERRGNGIALLPGPAWEGLDEADLAGAGPGA